MSGETLGSGRDSEMPFDGVEALLADDMLDLARILKSDILIDTQLHQPARQELVALVDHLGDCTTGWGQGDEAGLVHDNMILLAEVLHCDTDAGLFKAELCGDVHRADDGELSAQDQYGFQIILC